jgi:uncharacterized protein YraI
VMACLTLFSAWAFDWPKPPRCLINLVNGCAPPVIPTAGPTCLKADEKPSSGSCERPEGNFIVTNVRWDDPDHGLHVRASPAPGGISMGILPPNATEVVVGTCASGWCPVQCKNIKGYSSERYLRLRLSATYSVIGLSKGDTGLVIRNGPDETCSAVQSIPPEGRDVVLHICQLSPIDESRWCLVTYDKRSGWVPAENLQRQN